MKPSGFNSARRRARQLVDWARAASARLTPGPACEPFDGEPRVTLLSVSFNTRELTKLMLLSLADQSWARDLRRVVIVDNSSRDGSGEWLRSLTKTTRVEYVPNRGPSSHGFGLRHAVTHVEATESDWARERRSNIYLVVDTDIVFLRSDTLQRCCSAIAGAETGALGELQFDLGEPYAHPCCLFVRRDALCDARVWPFVDHGAPALWLERSLRCAGRKVCDFPLRSDDHIVHRGRASIAAVNRLGLRGIYDRVRDDAHYHGNARGAELWAEVERRHETRLGVEGDAACLRYLEANLGRLD